MVKNQEEMSPQDYLLARLQRLLLTQKNKTTLTDYLGTSYPLFGYRGQQKGGGTSWKGIKDMGFPFLVTKNRILTECYVQAICPDGLETVALDALVSGGREAPKDLHIRVWTPQPKKKGESPQHALAETVEAFQAAGITALEFMNIVKTAKNSKRFPEWHKKIDVSQMFFDEWMVAMRSGEPYICFLPESKSSLIPVGLRWFVSVLGISFEGGNRTITEADLQGRLGDGSEGNANSPEAIWLWKLREAAKAGLDMRKSGVSSTIASASLNLQPFRYELKDVVIAVKREDKGRGVLIETVGENLMQYLEDGKYSMVLQATEAMREDTELTEWLAASHTVDDQVRTNGFNVRF
jgi:hypothetical protein